jgi:hypothetical protein
MNGVVKIQGDLDDTMNVNVKVIAIAVCCRWSKQRATSQNIPMLMNMRLFQTLCYFKRFGKFPPFFGLDEVALR